MNSFFAAGLSSSVWIAWGILTGVMFALLLTAIISFSLIYKKNNIVFLNTRKISIMATFLAMYFCTIFLTILSKQMHLDFNYIIPLLVGFVMGPLEGILFSFVADTINTLLSGWILSYSPLSAMLLPMIGLIGGLAGYLYKKKEELPNWLSMILFQLTIIVILAIFFSTAFFVNNFLKDGKKMNVIVYGSLTILIIVSFEFSYLFFFFEKEEKKDITLFTIVFIAMTLSRMLGTIITPLGLLMSYKGNFETRVIPFLFHSSWIIPLETVVCFSLIKITNITLDLK